MDVRIGLVLIEEMVCSCEPLLLDHSFEMRVDIQCGYLVGLELAGLVHLRDIEWL